MMDDKETLDRLRADGDMRQRGIDFVRESARYRYSYHFTWLGRPIIQYPQDIVAMQELIWAVNPDLIVETGIAHGGSLVLYASMLELLGGDGMVVGVDVEIRPHNRVEIERHPMAKRITMIEGSSVDPATVDRVRALAAGRERVMVVLDSMHTHQHVRAELNAYSPLVTAGSYLVVFDTLLEEVPKSMFPDRPWGPGNNPKTAVDEFLRGTDRFVIDEGIDTKLLISVALGGYLKCVK
jgi:cephalosporin hydroxylase